MVNKYKLKTIAQFEAIKFTKADDFNLMLREWGESFQARFDVNAQAGTLKFYSQTGIVTASASNWIVKDANGNFSVITDSAFNSTYVKV